MARLNELNGFLTFFPNGNGNSKLPDDELIEIFDRAKPVEWHVAMLTANMDPSTLSLQEVTEYFERLEIMESLRKANDAKKSTVTANIKPGGGGGDEGNKKRKANDKTLKGDKFCVVCDSPTHNTADCFTVKKAQKMGGKKEDST